MLGIGVTHVSHRSATWHDNLAFSLTCNSRGFLQLDIGS